jgi:cell division protein FtsB
MWLNKKEMSFVGKMGLLVFVVLILAFLAIGLMAQKDIDAQNDVTRHNIEMASQGANKALENLKALENPKDSNSWGSLEEWENLKRMYPPK